MECYHQIHVVRLLNRIFLYLSLVFFNITRNCDKQKITLHVYYKKKRIYKVLKNSFIRQLTHLNLQQIQYLVLPYQTIFNQMPESLPKNTLGRK